MALAAGSSFLMVLQAVVGTVCWLSFLGLVSWVIGLAIFRPLYEKTLLFQVNSRYRISDILLLAAHVQVAAGIVFAFTPSFAAAERAVLVVSASALLCFWWGNGVRMLARAGVEYTWHRWLFLGIVMPGGYLTAILLTPAAICLPFGLVLLIGSLIAPPHEGAPSALIVLFCSTMILLIPVACYRVCRVIALRAREDRAQSDGIDFGHLQIPERSYAVRYRPAPTETAKRMTATNEDAEGIWLE